MRIVFALLAAVILASASPIASADTYRITLDEAVADEAQSGRLLVFFITETGRGWARRAPMQGPFFSRPQPIASIEVSDLKPGHTIEIDSFESSWPADLDSLDGPVRVQALLDVDDTARSHTEGPGNLYSEPLSVTLGKGADDVIELTLDQRIVPRTPGTDQENLHWVEFRSELLSEFYGRDVYHRAGVALPLQYLDEDYPRNEWGAIYVIPGYGGRHFGAEEPATMFHSGGIEEVAPMAVWIVLDPDSPLGHHGFVDSPNHGPRGTALVTEFIPYLESKYKLAPRPEGRLVTGHSSGGWSSLWLQLRWPEVFGGCWSSAPDPIDFTAFQMTDLYDDANMFVNDEGSETPSMRRISGPRGETTPIMTVRQEALMEHAIHPGGGSGQQWDAWEAMFSPWDTATGMPRPMFDALTGRIDREVVEKWSAFDITRKVAADWDHYGPIVLNKVRLVCGELDSFYLQRAVERFQAMVQEQRDGVEGDGYIKLHQFADHGSIQRESFIKTNETMREHLRKHGLHDW